VRLSYDNCDSARKLYCSYIHQLRGVELWPTEVTTLQEYRSRVSRMSSPTTEVCKGYRCYCQRGDVIKLQLLQEMDRVIESIEGMCLDCVYRSKMEGIERQCRVRQDAQPEY
jgi:hypothetical protein